MKTVLFGLFLVLSHGAQATRLTYVNVRPTSALALKPQLVSVQGTTAQATIRYIKAPPGYAPNASTSRYYTGQTSRPTSTVRLASTQRPSNSPARVTIPRPTSNLTVTGPTTMPSSSSGLVYPVAGPHRDERDFGKRGRHHHDGTDIFADKGTPVVSIDDGVIQLARYRYIRDGVWYYQDIKSYDRVTGRCVLTEPRRTTGVGYTAGTSITIRHKNFISRYFHLNNDEPGRDNSSSRNGIAGCLAPGTQIAKGQTIGQVGDSGNAENTPPHLHFEIADSRGRALDPQRYLESIDPTKKDGNPKERRYAHLAYRERSRDAREVTFYSSTTTTTVASDTTDDTSAAM